MILITRYRSQASDEEADGIASPVTDLVANRDQIRLRNREIALATVPADHVDQALLHQQGGRPLTSASDVHDYTDEATTCEVEIENDTWPQAVPDLSLTDITEYPSSDSALGLITAIQPHQPATASLLTPQGIRTFADVDRGSLVWSGTDWVQVLGKMPVGLEPVYQIKASRGTYVGNVSESMFPEGPYPPDHRLHLQGCLGEPVQGTLSLDPQDVLDGLLIGDGSLHKHSGNLIYLHVGHKDGDYFHSEIAPLLTRHRPGIKPEAWEVCTTLTPDELRHTYRRWVPDRFYHGSLVKMAGFLRGLFSANGCAVRQANISYVSLKQTSPLLVYRLVLDGPQQYWSGGLMVGCSQGARSG